MDEKSLGLRLQNARKAAGLTQQQLCQKSGLSYSTLAKIERGAIKAPSIFTIQQISGALETSIDVLVGHDAAKPTETLKKRSKSGISFVYFDINGCLVRFYHRAFGAAAEETGIPSDIIETSFWHYNDAVCRGEMTMEEFNTALARRFKIDKFEWGKYYLSAIEPIKDTQELLLWVGRHYKFGLLSNIMPGMVKAMLASAAIPNMAYDQVIESCEAGAIKPEQAIYETATQKAGVEPSSILLIDDSRSNLMAAERLGWHVMWFDDYRPDESVERIKQALAF
jgi:putative hydrolase of the HAD superfamily